MGVAADFPQDFNLLKCELTSSSGQTVDLRHQLMELSVWEDLENATVSGTVMLNDSNNQIMNLPIICFEQFTISFQTPDEDVWEETFEIYKIDDRNMIKERSQIYVLHLVAKEQIDNLKVRVSKSYKGALISDIVTDIHNKWLKGGTINVEPTQFMHHVIIPDLHPIQAINWLASRANAIGHKGAGYIYYEDRDGFNFVTSESLVEQPTSDTYVIQPANIRKQDTESSYKPRDLNTDMKAVQKWNVIDHVDVLKNMQAGMYGNELITHDLTQKKWERTKFDYADSFSKYKHLYPNMLYSTVRPDERNASAARKKFHSVGQDPFPFQTSNWLPIRISQLEQLHNLVVQITVPGDTTKKVGMVVDLMLPSAEAPIDGQQVYDKFYKGRYLISTVRHSINSDQFTSVMTLVKDSVFTAYP